MSQFPTYRPRRLRMSEAMRNLVRETSLSPADFIYPLFVVHGEGVKREISSMPVNTMSRSSSTSWRSSRYDGCSGPNSRTVVSGREVSTPKARRPRRS